MVAAMSDKLRKAFFMAARLQFTAFDDLIADRRAASEDFTCWIALREWLYEQPFDVDPSLPLPTAEQARQLWLVETFERILAHVKTRPLASILDQLPPRWRRETLRDLLRGMRPGLPTILATCRAHGQDEGPWHILMAWEAWRSIRRAAARSPSEARPSRIARR